MKDLFTALFLLLIAGSSHAGILPDLTLTSGTAYSNVTTKDVCSKGWAKKHRKVTNAMRDAVFRQYQTPYEPGRYEVDHLIPLELGGTNDISNLWPEAYEPRPGAHEKDEVENELHWRVCLGQMSLQEAQSVISQDWYTFYRSWKEGINNDATIFSTDTARTTKDEAASMQDVQ